METKRKQSFPRWLFAILSICGLLASGIFIGIMSIQGFTATHLALSAGFGILGLLMFLGSLSKE